jgi:hypothetical protein
MLYLAARPAPEGGWLGHWSPGIGDPSFMGWATTFLYLLTSLQCWRLIRRGPRSFPRSEALIWWSLAIGLLVLGLNKQLDLQTAFTETGRILARRQGWYEARRSFQLGFVAFFATITLLTSVGLLYFTRHASVAARVAVFGMVVLLGFILIRGVSFHHVDRFLRSSLLELRANWLFEIGGILLILGAAVTRERQARRARHPGRRVR